jgi:hypothetical protein
MCTTNGQSWNQGGVGLSRSGLTLNEFLSQIDAKKRQHQTEIIVIVSFYIKKRKERTQGHSSCGQAYR